MPGALRTKDVHYATHRHTLAWQSNAGPQRGLEPAGRRDAAALMAMAQRLVGCLRLVAHLALAAGRARLRGNTHRSCATAPQSLCIAWAGSSLPGWRRSLHRSSHDLVAR